MVRVKICGITIREDALFACEVGADALGFVFFRGSPRFVNVEKAREIVNNLPPFVITVGVFVDERLNVIKRIVENVGLDMVQLHGEESPEFCDSLRNSLHKKAIKTFRIQGSGVRGQGSGKINPDPRTPTPEPFIQPSAFSLAQYHVSAYLLDTYQEDMAGGTGRVFDWDIAVRAKRYGRIILAGGLNPDNIKEAVERVKPYGVDVSSGVEMMPGKKDPDKVRDFITKVKGI